MRATLTKSRIDTAVSTARATAETVELVDEREPGLRLRARERGAKWSVMVRLKTGQRTRVTLGSWPAMDVSAARKAAQDVKRKTEAGENPNEEKRAARSHKSLRELIDIYADAKLAQLRTGDQAKRAIDAALAKLMDRDPASITRRDIAGTIDKIATNAPTHANRSLAYIKAFFTWAVGRGHLSVSPADGITKPADEISRDRTPTIAELVEIWRASERLAYPFGHAVQLLIATAMRREEVTGIAVSELDLADKRQGIFTLPANRSKNDRAIRVPLSPLARSVVDRALAARPIIESTGKPSSLLFSTTGTTPASGWSKAKARLDGYIMEARQARAAESGEDAEAMPAWRLHDLRRAFATAACDILHVDPAVADRCLNHVGASTRSTISRVYGRSEMFDQRQAALTAWGALLERAIKGEVSTNVVPIGSASRG